MQLLMLHLAPARVRVLNVCQHNRKPTSASCTVGGRMMAHSARGCQAEPEMARRRSQNRHMDSMRTFIFPHTSLPRASTTVYQTRVMKLSLQGVAHGTAGKQNRVQC